MTAADIDGQLDGLTHACPSGRCLGLIVKESWAHHQFAERDLDELDRTNG